MKKDRLKTSLYEDIIDGLEEALHYIRQEKKDNKKEKREGQRFENLKNKFEREEE